MLQLDILPTFCGYAAGHVQMLRPVPFDTPRLTLLIIIRTSLKQEQNV